MQQGRAVLLLEQAAVQAQLEKDAGVVDIAKTLGGRAAGWGRTMGSALRNPLQTARAGWRSMEAGRLARQGAQLASGTGEAGWKPIIEMAKKDPARLKELQSAYQQATGSGGRRFLGLMGPSKATHLLEESKGLGEAIRSGGVRGAAEELSRSGWTGQGRITKYLPGRKASVALAVPQAATALRKPTEEEKAQGLTRGRKAGRALGRSAALLVTAANPMSWMGTMAAESALRRGGETLGSGISRGYGAVAGRPAQVAQGVAR